MLYKSIPLFLVYPVLIILIWEIGILWFIIRIVSKIVISKITIPRILEIILIIAIITTKSFINK